MKDWSILLKSIHQKRPRTRVNEEDNDAVHKWDLSFIRKHLFGVAPERSQ